jgi:hypothetical protein
MAKGKKVPTKSQGRTTVGAGGIRQLPKNPKHQPTR